VYAIVAEAVELEREFCCEALSVSLVGMNKELMAKVRRAHKRCRAGLD
jgi:ribonucleoside-diphosphate reductase subunit M2